MVSACDNGKTLSVKVGQEISISLEGNLTTGYSWIRKDSRSDVVQVVGEVKYEPDAHAPGMTGAGGLFTAKYRAVKVGQATVELEYRRPWEKAEKRTNDGMFRVTFDVKK
jgi:inhibitor of cysteine peptidase